MHIEDLITSLVHNRVTVNSWDAEFIKSIYYQTLQSTGFTEKQSTVAVRIIKRYATSISHHEKCDILPYLEFPKYRFPIRKAVNTRSINIIEDTNYSKLIEVKFPYDDSTIADFRKFKNSSHIYFDNHVSWDKDKSAWVFALNEENIKFLSEYFKELSADYDTDFQNYCEQLETVIANIDTVVPTLVATELGFTINNASKYVPKITSTDMLAAVFEARRYGINMWDESINEYLNNNIDAGTSAFLKNDLATSTQLSNDEAGVTCLKNIIKYLGPSLFIIPGGSELKKLKQIYNIVHDMGIDDKNISVLFRLDSTSGKEFNEFVKNHNLNNPVANSTQVVIVSGRLPKPLIAAKIRFNSTVNLGFDSAHYTLRDHVKSQHNLIYFDLEEHKHRGFDFGKL